MAKIAYCWDSVYTLEEWVSELTSCSSGCHIHTEYTDEYMLLQFVDTAYYFNDDGEVDVSDELIEYEMAISMAEFGRDDDALFDRCADVLRDLVRDVHRRHYAERQRGGRDG